MCQESHGILVTKAEKFIIEGLKQLLVSDSLQYRISLTPSSTSIQEQELRQMLSRLDQREKRAKDAYLNEIDTLQEYKDTKAQIQNERNRIQKELQRVSLPSSQTASSDDLLMIQNVQTALAILTDPNSNLEKKGLAIRSVVDKIVYDRKNTSFDFHLKLVK